MIKLLLICDEILPNINNDEILIARLNSKLDADINIKYDNYCYTINGIKVFEVIDEISFIDDKYIPTLPYIPYYQNNIFIKIIYVLHLLKYENLVICNMNFIDPLPFYENRVLDNSISAITLLDLYMSKQVYDIVNFSLYNDDLCLPICIPRYDYNMNLLTVEKTLYDYLFNTQDNRHTVQKYISILKLPIKTIEYMLCDEYKKIYWKMIDNDFTNKYKNIDKNLKVPINKHDFDTILSMYKYDYEIYANIANIDKSDKIYVFLHFLTFEKDKEIFNLPNNFTIKMYKKLNSDLKDLNDRDLLTHFISQGQIEERNIYDNLSNFNWKIYIEMNNLQINSKYEAENHYLTFGIDNKLLSTKSLPALFDYDLYLFEKPNIKDMKTSDIIKPYLLSDTNKVMLPNNYNSKEYASANPDLKLGDKSDEYITKHFINYGIFEKRDIALSQIKYYKTILLICHIGDIKVFKKMEHYIQNAINSQTNVIRFKIVLNVINTLLEIDKQYINNKYIDYEIIYNDNFGFDIGSFFLYLKKCKENNITFDYIVKLHTKTSDIERDNLIKPILGSVNRIRLIIDMLDNEKIGLVGSKRCMFYNYNKLALQNQNWLYYLIKKYDINLSSSKMVQFVGGTIFFIRFSILNNLFSKHNFDDIISELNNEYSFDWNWYICANKDKFPDLLFIKCKEDALIHYNNNVKKYQISGNLFHALKYNTKSLKLRDAMIEHAYERLFSYIVEDKQYEQIFLPYESYIDILNIQPVPIIFPQFHVIPENDKFWSDGFTEWTMLNKVTHNYLGKELLTPHKDIGQYNILTDEYLSKTEFMMKNYLINTVIYYHYWFNGHKVMYKPIEKIRDEGKPNVNYVLSWANETWSSRWDGQDNQILLKQDYGTSKDWTIHIEYLLTFFKSKNYVKIDNKPLFFIYRPLDIPYETFNSIMALFLDKVISQGFAGMKLIIFYNNTTNLKAYEQYANNKYVDGVMDFNPNYTNTKSFTNYQEVDKDSSIFENDIYNEEIYLTYNIDVKNAVNRKDIKSGLEHYNNISEIEKQSRIYKSSIGNIVPCYNYIENEPKKHKLQLYSTFMGWDNTARRDITQMGMKPTIFLGASPQIFEQHVKNMVLKIIKNPNMGINWLILNAWNEWNEQTVLEPSSKDGYKYLETIKKIFSEYY